MIAWQHCLEHIDPVAFSIGFFSVRWYALWFVVGIFSVWLVMEYQKKTWPGAEQFLDEVFLVLLVGGFLGARIGYVLWYAPEYFQAYPEAIFSPFDPVTGRYVGFFGMSFYGALCGAGSFLVGWSFIRKEKFLIWVDRLALVLPLGIFFGRMGNFFNGELFGRSTEMPWGVVFPTKDLVLRHPSPLYEAVGEGLLLFGILWILNRKMTLNPGQLLAFFLIGYGGIRFELEFFREPDMYLGYTMGFLTLGQIFSLLAVLIGSGLWIITAQKARKLCYTEGSK